MALFTSVQTGDFDTASTWDVGSGFPGVADTFAIVATHTVTIPNALAANTTGNVDGSGTGTRGILVIADGGELKLTANMTVTNYNKLQFEAGSTFDLNGFDILTNTSSLDRNFFEFVGTPANRITVKSSVAGSGDISRTTGDGVAGIQDFQYIDFLDCGEIKIGNNFSAMDFNAQWLLFDGCQKPTLGGFHELTQVYVIEHIDVRNSLATGDMLLVDHDIVGTGSGTKSIDSITAVASGAATSMRWTIESLDRTNIVSDRILHTSVNGRGGDLVDSAVRMGTAGGATVDNGGLDAAVRCLLFSDSDNPHTTTGAINAFTDCVVNATYSLGYTDDGDHYILNAAIDCISTGTLVIDDRSGVYFNALGGAKSSDYTGNNNTLIGNYDVYGSLFRTEGGGSVTGTMDNYNNITYSRSLTAGSRGYNFDAATPAADQITNMDFNAWINIDDIYYGLTSATKTPGVTTGYGGNDLVDVDPEFFDDTRDFTSWAGIFASAATSDAGMEDLTSINGYDSINRTQDPALITSNTVADMVSWIRAGFAPTNPLYEASGLGGVDIGAIPYQAAGGGGTGAIVKSIVTSLVRPIIKA